MPDRVKETVNRLVEHWRYKQRQRNKVPAQRPGIKGRLGSAARGSRENPS